MPLKNFHPQLKNFIRRFGIPINPNERIRGFNEVWCSETLALLTQHGIEDGYAKTNIVMPGARKPTSNHREHQVYRGYPLDNMFSRRGDTDGGPHTVPLGLGKEILDSLDQSEHTFSMKKFTVDMGRKKITSHLTGSTSFRSFADNIAIAVAFAAAKCSENSAFCWDHADNTGSLLLASLCDVAKTIKPDQDEKDDIAHDDHTISSTIKSYEYQKERAGAILPYSRHECTTVLYNKDDKIKVRQGFNIYHPLYKPIKTLLKANISESIVQEIHRYDHNALLAAIKLGKIYYELMDGQDSSQDRRSLLQEQFTEAYQESLFIENEFSEFFKSTVEHEIARGNHQAISLRATHDINAKDANTWFYSALCLAMGEYQSYGESPITCEITNKHEFLLKIPQEDGTIASKRFSKTDALSVIPACMIGAFNLLKQGQLDMDNIPEPMFRALGTLFVNKLIAKRDPCVNSIQFKILDSTMIQALSDTQVASIVQGEEYTHAPPNFRP